MFGTADPTTDLLLGLLKSDVIKNAESADQSFALAGHEGHVVNAQPSPLLAGLAVELRPLDFEWIPVHGFLLRVDGK